MMCVWFDRGYKILIRRLEINFQPMVSWMLLGLCIPNTSCNQIVMHLIPNTLTFLKTTFYYGKTHKVNEQKVKVHLVLNANDLIANKASSSSQ
jgi:hypothetical protein